MTKRDQLDNFNIEIEKPVIKKEGKFFVLVKDFEGYTYQNKQIIGSDVSLENKLDTIFRIKGYFEKWFKENVYKLIK